MYANSTSNPTGTAQTSAMAFTKTTGSANVDDLATIENGRIKVKFSGKVIVSGYVYVIGSSGPQVHAGISKYNSAATSYTQLQRVWTPSNATSGQTLSLPSIVIPVTNGESITVIGGSAGSYTLGANNAEYNALNIIFLPD